MSVQPGQTPPIVQPKIFDLATAQLCATLTDSAYDQFAQWANQNYPLPASFRWVPNGPSNLKYSPALWGNAVVLGTSNWEPFGFVASDSRSNVYVAYRGTMTKADEWNDADISQVTYSLVTNPSFGYVASGFYSIYTTALSSQHPSLRDVTLESINGFKAGAVYLTGHSLGAAMCTLVVPDAAYNLALLPIRGVLLYNFASPRVGDPTFADSMNNKVVKKVPSWLFRVVNTEDAVPAVPPAVSVNYYEHVGTPVSFTAQYGTTLGNHSIDDCYIYAINHPDAPQGPVKPFVNYVTGFVGGNKFVPRALIVPPPPA
jgi:triacylglycerol lipase